MAILKSKDIAKMSNSERNDKIKDLKSELMREKVNLGKGGKIKIKEIKKTIARLHTFNRQEDLQSESSGLSKSKDSRQLNKSVDDK